MEDAEPAVKNWWHSAWVRHMCIWVPILVSACLLVAGIVLVIFFRGRVCHCSTLRILRHQISVTALSVAACTCCPGTVCSC